MQVASYAIVNPFPRMLRGCAEVELRRRVVSTTSENGISAVMSGSYMNRY
jgi:hypothetical protein